MLKRVCQYRSVWVLLVCPLFAGVLYGQARGLAAQWTFARGQGAAPRDTVSGVKAKISGYYKYVRGASGDGLRFDGYTTSMTIPAQDVPATGKHGFTVKAWVALNTYPWNWVPVVDQEEQRQEGFFFGIDAFGHIGLQTSIDGRWRSVTSTFTLPLKKWAHITGVFETAQNQGWLKLYLDGKPVGQLAVRGELTPAHTDMLIGRIRRATLPFPQAAIASRCQINTAAILT